MHHRGEPGVDLIKTSAAPLLLVAAACVLVLALAGCVPAQPQAQMSGEDMATTVELVQGITIPKLDGAAPGRTETATFALG